MKEMCQHFDGKEWESVNAREDGTYNMEGVAQEVTLEKNVKEASVRRK